MINFSVHQVRAGMAGASEDFEQMLALLVHATFGEGNLVFANPGDWGIDVLIGDLRGQATIWQAKYFIRGVAKSQKVQIEGSFESAVRAAAAHGYQVARWILCIPSSMDAQTKQWWCDWKFARHRATGISIDLWDETELRELLLKPAATHVRRHYYNPYREDAPVVPVVEPAVPEPPVGWRGGSAYRVGGAMYLLHDESTGLTEQSSPDHSWVWREATADRVEPGTGRVRLRQIEVSRPGPMAEERRTALEAQAGLASELRGRAGLPSLVDLRRDPERTTVVTAHPSGLRWAEVFGPASTPPDRLRTASIMAAAAHLCAGLAVLHDLCTSHRALDPHALYVDRSQRCFVRDLGYAAFPGAPGEGTATYRAPEQQRAPYRSDGRTDIYQLAAVVYHTVTGYPPGPGASPPVRATLPDFPEALDRVLIQALASDPKARPASISALADAFRAGRHALSRGGAG